jgi:hypothetical protein
MKIIDILATYGEKGIPAIQDILNNAMSTTTANYATDVLKRLKTCLAKMCHLHF